MAVPADLVVNLHLALGVAVATAAGVGLAVALVPTLRGLPPPGQVVYLQRALIVATVVAAALGVALYLGGHRPREQVHLLYGVVALLVIPGARRLAVTQPGRRQFFDLAGMALLVGVLLRLATTG